MSTFPDPVETSQGIEPHGPAGIGPNSLQFKSAQKARQSLQPGGV
jgi:hypothetical protein